MASKRRQLIEKWFDGFKTFDGSTVANYRTDEAEHIVVPTPPGLPWDNIQTRNFFSQWEGVTAGAHHEPHYWVDDEKQNRLAVYTTMTMQFKPELSIENYVGDYVLMFEFTEDQEQITKFIEFIDTGTTQHILRKVNEGLEKLGRPSLGSGSPSEVAVAT